MMRQTVRRLSITLLVLAVSFAAASPAFAQEDHETAREAGPVIRHQLLYRSTRVELAPLAGMTLADSYLRNGILGATLAYHLTNEWGLNIVGGYGVAQLDTDLRDKVQSTLEGAAPDRLNDLSFAYIKWLVGAEIQYVPIIGKFSLFNSAIANYDIHLIGGFSFVGEAAQAAVDGGDTDPQLEGLRPAPTIGLGTRIFLGDGISANLDVRDYLYSAAEVSSLTANPEFSNHVMVSLGVSFFFPQAVQISR